MESNGVRDRPRSEGRSLARLVLLVFGLTFASARIMVFLIMARRVPDLYLHLGGNHVHHLNYGIFLLSAVGGYLVFVRPEGRSLRVAAVVYAIGLALTFDEFGMWLHLGGSYWQRASYDAVVVIAALLGLIAYSPPPNRWKPNNWWAAAAVALVSVTFAALLIDSLSRLERKIQPPLERLEQEGPPE